MRPWKRPLAKKMCTPCFIVPTQWRTIADLYLLQFDLITNAYRHLILLQEPTARIYISAPMSS